MLDSLKGETGAENLSSQSIDEVLLKYGPSVFGGLTKLFNFCFEFRNDGYEPVSPEWIEENLTVRELIEVAKEVAVQNRLDWMLPFFRKQIAVEMAKL